MKRCAHTFVDDVFGTDNFVDNAEVQLMDWSKRKGMLTS